VDALDVRRARVPVFRNTRARGSQGGDFGAAIAVLEDTAKLRESVQTRTGHTGHFWTRTQLLLADLYRQGARIEAPT
jgi:hypothetical protein